jgi:predicted small lipoprotein YifL
MLLTASAFRRASVAALLLLLAACGSVTGEPAAVPDAAVSGKPDAGPDASQAHGSVQVTIQDMSFTACRCHHGFGLGINGTATVHVVNSGASPVTLTPGAFVLRDPMTGKSYTTNESGEQNSFSYYSLENVPGTEANPPTPPSFQPLVAAGASTDISVSFYIDDVTWPVPPTPYVLEVNLGAGATATSKTFALSEALDASTP